MKVLATKDGGCLLSGTRYNYNLGIKERDIFIIKLNKEGILIGTLEKPSLKMHEALVFPNPGSSYLRVRIASQHHHSTFELFDMSGKKMLAEQINRKWGEIDTRFLKTGTCIYKIYNNSGLLETGKWVKR